MRIYYCEKCETRLTEEDVASGSALLGANDHMFCARCAPPELVNASTGKSKCPPTRHSESLPRGVKQTSSHAAISHPRQSGEHRAASASRSNIPAAQPQQKKFPMKWAVLGGAVPLLALGFALYAFDIFGKGSKTKPPSETVAAPAASPQSPAAVGSDSPRVPDKKPPESPEDKPRSAFDDMLKAHDQKLDSEHEKTIAARHLAEARQFAKDHPQDPWTYLEKLRDVQTGTPAGDEAAQTIIALKLPADKSETAGWYRDWEFALGLKGEPRYDFDGHGNVVQTQPPSRDSDALFKRRLAISADKPYFVVTARCDDKCASKIAVEVNGKQQLLEDLKGPAWSTFDLNLSALKGTEADVQIRHIVTGSATPSVFWTPPVFRAAADSGAKHLVYNSSAIAYAKPKPAPAPPKRAFVASAAWKPSDSWKKPLDVLALADVKSGAVAGEWKRGEKGELISDNAKGARLGIAQTLPEQYDIRVTFERRSGNSDAVLILSRGGKMFVWQIGADNNRIFTIAQVAGKKFEGNPATVRANACLKNNQRYTTVVEVRKERVSAYLDGKLITEWVPEMGELSLEASVWHLPDGKTLGVASWQSEMAFYSFELVEVK